ncbi:NRDE family protein [Haloglomus litoreum]|uniref:NRDE family protein n=1 Tax=Haloglomus litoreum TaxID=3034026 RepID=UPI0023E80C59|nr:NRDE family protein [Haloglomus sp. DT116]
MCTLVLAWQVFADAPVTVAANRDEADGRPSSPPAVRDGPRRYVAPRDDQAGGTWMGYNEAGLFVGITNRWKPLTGGERSRGLLVQDALGHETAEDAARFVERTVEKGGYNPFHLVLADANAAIICSWDGRLSVRNFDPGVHVVVNVGWDGNYFVPEERPDVGLQQAEDTNRVREVLQPEPGETALEWTERAGAVLGDPEYGRCIHGDGFGTQSSSLLRLGPEGAVFEYADGKPCETEYEPVPGFDGPLAERE